MSKTKYCIIGAGLSGLTTAYNLLKRGERDFIILEGKAEAGGRILRRNGVDLGATWFQDFHTNLSSLMEELKIKRFPQYGEGKNILVYNTNAAPHYFESDRSDPAANRIVGGSISIIEKLAELVENKIKTSTTVTSIIENSDEIIVKTNNEIYNTEKVIVTLPPQLASGILYSPTLPDELVHGMKNTHTWMSNAIKVGVEYDKPFWRAKGFSGTIIGQVGPTIELYDHSNYEDNKYALMGFVNESLRQVDAEHRKEMILIYLEKYLGAEAREYNNYNEKDWSIDKYTSNQELNSTYITPQYGNPIFQNLYYNDKLLFSGTETSPQYGGYLEGAVISGTIAATKFKD